MKALPDDTNIVFYIGANQFKKKKYLNEEQLSKATVLDSLKACIIMNLY